MLPNVTYRKRERHYVVVNPDTGEEESFSRGLDGRREAMRRAVCFENDRLHRIVTDLIKRLPALESRAWRAAVLVVSDGIQPTDAPDALALVRSSNEFGDYVIKVQDSALICDCLDYMGGGAPYAGPDGQRVCKHILAVQFTHRLAYRRCGSCTSRVDADLEICPYCGGPVTPY